MEKKESSQYSVEREFLDKISIEELLIRIVKAHLETGFTGEKRK